MEHFKNLIIFVCLFIGCQITYGQQDHICYYMLNSEIKTTLEESGRQKKMEEKQLTNLAGEKANKSQWFHYKAQMANIQKRLNSTSLALQALPSVYKISQEIQQIYTLQDKILFELEQKPSDIKLIFKDQITFGKDVQMTIQLMAGIILSYGTINQMERAERKILLDFVADEFKRIRIHSWTTLTTLRMAKSKQKLQQNFLKNWVQKDKTLIKDIIQNANAY